LKEVSTSSVLKLPFAASSASIARRCLVSDLVSAGIYESAVSDAAVVVSELFSNALRHARPLPGSTIRVSWQLDAGSVRVSVQDGGGPTLPELGELDQSTTGGRGLRIVARLSKDWGTRCDDEGTTVWAVIPAPSRVLVSNAAAGGPGQLANYPGDPGTSGDAQCHVSRGQTAKSVDYVQLSPIDRVLN
jgi:anti-sigma regulatory factor (Ser/Thr protein kinase)